MQQHPIQSCLLLLIRLSHVLTTTHKHKWSIYITKEFHLYLFEIHLALFMIPLDVNQGCACFAEIWTIFA